MSPASTDIWKINNVHGELYKCHKIENKPWEKVTTAHSMVNANVYSRNVQNENSQNKRNEEKLTLYGIYGTEDTTSGKCTKQQMRKNPKMALTRVWEVLKWGAR